jgi:predicted metal-dependent hydrolase
MHGREHRSFNERLGGLGYPTRLLDRITHYGLGFGERVLPKSYQLAITAALEHYTATLAEVLLTDADARDLLDLESVRSLFLWHALEESEHKSVAFDVYRTTSGNHWVRVGVMNATTLGFLGGIGLAVLLSMLTDPTTYRHPARAVRSFLALRRSPWLKTEILRRLRDYNRRDFHPDDHDNAALTAEWREHLFGAEGSMTELVRSGADSAA